MMTLSTQLTWWYLSASRGVLEVQPAASGHELALELEVLWGDGDSEPTLCTWRLSRNGKAGGLIDAQLC